MRLAEGASQTAARPDSAVVAHFAAWDEGAAAVAAIAHAMEGAAGAGFGKAASLAVCRSC